MRRSRFVGAIKNNSIVKEPNQSVSRFINSTSPFIDTALNPPRELRALAISVFVNTLEIGARRYRDR